ncbi:MAG: DUF2812 domain-containing protein [Firmicutes bacterium]|nr:DUF2812 domain-containing protein [Bacillota bacterium]
MENNGQTILEEKQRFYLSEFREEAAWLSFMHRQGWKFLSTTGCRYRFEACEKEDWVYQLDFKEDGAYDEDYIRLFADYGWEYVYQHKEWFYFRKLRTPSPLADTDSDRTLEPDLSIFSDNQSKAEMCKRIINRQFLRILPLYFFILVYNYLIFGTSLLDGEDFGSGFLLGVSMVFMVATLISFGYFLGQYHRLQKIMKDLEPPV